MRLAIAVAVSVVIVPVFVVAVLMGGLISGSAVIRARMLARHRRSTSKLSMRAMTLTKRDRLYQRVSVAKTYWRGAGIR